MKNAKNIALLIFLLGLSTLNSFSQTDKLFGLVGSFLVELDLTNGKATEIGQIDKKYAKISGFTYHPGLDKLFAVCNFDSDPKLIKIDPQNASVIEVGKIKLTSSSKEMNWIESLTYNYQDGSLYGAGNFSGQPSNRVFKIDSKTGEAEIYPHKFSNTCEKGDLDGLLSSEKKIFAVDGCYYKNRTELYEVDLLSGSTKFINYTPFKKYLFLTAINLSNGNFYLASPIKSQERNLYSYSAKTGTAELIGKTHEKSDFDSAYLTRLAYAKKKNSQQDSFKERKIKYASKKIIIKSNDVKLSLWDDAKEDGDIVSIFINDETNCVIPKYKVKKQPAEFSLSLTGRENLLIFFAENEGKTPPNTAALTIDDGHSVQQIILSADKLTSEALQIIVEK